MNDITEDEKLRKKNFQDALLKIQKDFIQKKPDNASLKEITYDKVKQNQPESTLETTNNIENETNSGKNNTVNNVSNQNLSSNPFYNFSKLEKNSILGPDTTLENDPQTNTNQVINNLNNMGQISSNIWPNNQTNTQSNPKNIPTYIQNIAKPNDNSIDILKVKRNYNTRSSSKNKAANSNFG